MFFTRRCANMLQIYFYTRDHCTLCDQALDLLKMFENKYPHTIERRDITTNVDWLRKYRTEIPVLEINGDELKAEELNIVSLEQFLERHT